VSTMYLTTYKYIAFLWVILGFCLVFWSANPVWRLGGPHGLEAQILLVVFNLLVTYVLCYRLWEALSPLVRKESMKLTIDSGDDVEKVRLTLIASLKSLFLRSTDHRPPVVQRRGKSVWNSGWTLVNNKDDGEVECAVPGHRKMDTMGGDSEDPGAFRVETQILSDYDRSSDNEVRILIQESDEAPFSPEQTNQPVRKLFTLPEIVESQQQERLECDPLLSHKDETADSQQSSVPLLSSIVNGPLIEKDTGESKSSEMSPQHEKSVSQPKQESTIDATSSQPLLMTNNVDEAEGRSAEIKPQVDIAQQPTAVIKQTQDQAPVVPDGVKLNTALSKGNGEVAVKGPKNIV